MAGWIDGSLGARNLSPSADFRKRAATVADTRMGRSCIRRGSVPSDAGAPEGVRIDQQPGSPGHVWQVTYAESTVHRASSVFESEMQSQVSSFQYDSG